MDLGYRAGLKSIEEAHPKVLYLIGADEKITSRDQLPADCFVIYQGNIIIRITGTGSNYI